MLSTKLLSNTRLGRFGRQSNTYTSRIQVVYLRASDQHVPFHFVSVHFGFPWFRFISVRAVRLKRPFSCLITRDIHLVH